MKAKYKVFFCQELTPLVRLGLLYDVLRSHSDTPHSVGLFWSRDRPVVETSTRQYTTVIRDREVGPI
jgi:hypothetical protein